MGIASLYPSYDLSLAVLLQPSGDCKKLSLYSHPFSLFFNQICDIEPCGRSPNQEFGEVPVRNSPLSRCTVH